MTDAGRYLRTAEGKPFLAVMRHDCARCKTKPAAYLAKDNVPEFWALCLDCAPPVNSEALTHYALQQ